MSATSCDVTKIQDEDILRKMWQDTEDFGKKKEIRAHMYKLREARLRDFYNNESSEKDIRRSHSSSNMREQRKVTENTHHADSLLDHSFLSLKSKEIRDSESPTRDITYKINDKLSTDKGWTIRESKERSQDGKTHTINRLATTSGSEVIDKGVANYAAKNEQHSSVYQDGDDKNFVKAVGASNRSVIQQEARGGDDNSQFYSASTTTKSSSKFVSEQKSSSDDFGGNQQITRTTYDGSRSTPDDFCNRTITRGSNRSDNVGKETITRKTYDYNIPEELKKSPNYIEGKTKVYTETKTLPDGSTVTSTRYETIGGSSSYSTTKKQVNTQQEQKQQQNVASRQTVVKRTDGGTVRSEEFVIQPNIQVKYIEGKRSDVYDQKNLINREEIRNQQVVNRFDRDEKHITNREEKVVRDQNTTCDVKVIRNQTEQRGVHDDQNQSVRTVTRRTEHYEQTIPDDTKRPTNREEIVITRSSPTETIITKKGPTQTVVTKTTTVRTVGGKVDDKTIAEDFINTEKQQRVHESGDVRKTVTKVVRKTENDIQPVFVEEIPRDDKTITKVTRVVTSKTYGDETPKPREPSPTKTPQEQVCKPAPVRSAQQEPKYQQPERRQPIKQKPEIDSKTQPTEGQYDTTYRTDYITKKISVEVSPTHDAFARSLRSVTPERDRKSTSPSLRTSTSSLRSSTSPEKRYPRRQSPDRYDGTPKRGNRYSPERRDGSPRKSMPDRNRYTPDKRDDSPRKTRPAPSYRDESPRKTPSDRDVSPRKARPSLSYRDESPRKTPQYRDDSPRKTPQRDDSPRKARPSQDSPRQTPERYSPRKPSQERITTTYNTDTITRKKQTHEIDTSTLTRRSKTKQTPRSRSSSPTDTVSDFEYQPRPLVTDLDEPQKPVYDYPTRKDNVENISTTTTVTRKTKKVTERSPTSPIKQSPVKETPRRSSLRSTRHPDMESPTDFKPFTPKPNEKVLRRTDTYEERCRLILGIPDTTKPRKPSLPEAARSSKSPEKKSPTQRRPSEDQPRRQAPPKRQDSPTKSIPKDNNKRPSVQEFPAQVRKSPEKQPREESPIKRKPKTSDDSPQVQEFPSQIRKSSERRPQEEYPITDKPRKFDGAPQVQEFPSQIRKTPERRPKEDSPLREQPRKPDDAPHLQEFPAQIRKTPERTPKEEYPIKEKPQPDYAPQLQEFPAQSRKSPERIQKEDSPIREKPRRPDDAPQLQEFPSQTRKSPESRPGIKRPEFDDLTPTTNKKKSPKKKLPNDDDESTTDEEYKENVETTISTTQKRKQKSKVDQYQVETTEICTADRKPINKDQPDRYDTVGRVTTEYVIIGGRKVPRENIPKNKDQPERYETVETVTTEYVIIDGRKVPRDSIPKTKNQPGRYETVETVTTEYVIIDGKKVPRENIPKNKDQPERYETVETVTTEYVIIDGRKVPRDSIPKNKNQPGRYETVETVTTEYVIIDGKKVPRENIPKNKDQPERYETVETVTTEYVIIDGKKVPRENIPKNKDHPERYETVETVTTEYVIIDGRKVPRQNIPKNKRPEYEVTETTTTEEYVIVGGKKVPKKPKQPNAEDFEVTETTTTEEYIIIDGRKYPKQMRPDERQPKPENKYPKQIKPEDNQPQHPGTKGYNITEKVTTEEYTTTDSKKQPKKSPTRVEQPKQPKQATNYKETETVTTEEYVIIDGKKQPKQPRDSKQPNRESTDVTEVITTEECVTIDDRKQPKKPGKPDQTKPDDKQPKRIDTRRSEVTETTTTQEYVVTDDGKTPKRKIPDDKQQPKQREEITETVTTEEYIIVDGKRQPKSPKKKQPGGYQVTETVTTEDYVIIDGKRQPKPQSETTVTEEFVIIDGKKVFTDRSKKSDVKVVITTTKETPVEDEDKPRKSPEKQMKKPKDNKPESFDVTEVVTTTTTTKTERQPKPDEQTPKPKSVKDRINDINICKVTNATTEFITKEIEDDSVITRTQPKSKPVQPKKDRKIPTSEEININQEFIRRIIEDDTIESYTQEIEEQEKLKQKGSKPTSKQPTDKKKPTSDEPDEPRKSFVDSILSKITKEEYDVVNKYSKILNEDEDTPKSKQPDDEIIKTKKVQPTSEAKVKPVLTKQMTQEEKIAHAIRYSQGERVPVEEPIMMKRLSYDVYDDSDDEPSKRRESPKRPSPIKRQPGEDKPEETVSNFLINEQIEFEVKRSPERLSPVKGIPDTHKTVKKDLSRKPNEVKKPKTEDRPQRTDESPKIKHKVIAKVDLQKPKPKDTKPDTCKQRPGMVEIRLKRIPSDGLPKSKPKGVTRDDSPKSRPKTVTVTRDDSPKPKHKPATRDESPKPKYKQAIVEVKPKLKTKTVVNVNKVRTTTRDESPKPKTTKTVDAKKTKVTTCVVNIKETKPKVTTTVVKTVRNGVLKEPKTKPSVTIVDTKPMRETNKRTTVSTTINLKSKPKVSEKHPRSKAKPVQNGYTCTDDEDHDVPQRKKCVSTKSIIINNTVADEREIIVNLQRSKSSREETPDRVWPVTTDEDTGIPRYPDQISEPDEPRRVLKKVNDVPLVEDEDVTEFSRITELIDAKITEVDRVQETDECLLTVNEKVNKFSSTPKGKPKNVGPAPKVDRPKLVVDEHLEEDDCLLSVSDKVSKFITTAEKLSVSEVPERPKSPRCQNIPSDCLTEKVNKFIESAELLTKRERSPPKKNSVDILPVITRSTVEECSTIVTEEDMYRVPRSEDNKPSKPNTRASPEKVFRLPQEEQYGPGKRTRPSPERVDKSPHEHTPERVTRLSPEKVTKPSDEVTQRSQSREKVTPVKSTPESPRKSAFTTPKDQKTIPNNRTHSRHLIDENTTPKSSKRVDDTPVGRLRSTESIKKARALFENYDKERPKQIDILSRPSVFEGRKIKMESGTELKSTKMIESIRRSQSPGEVPHYMTEIERTVRQGSPHKETPHKSTSPTRERSTDHTTDKDIPHYMTNLDRSMRHKSPQKESPNELRPESPHRERTPVNENIPHYMTQLDRSLRQKSPHVESVRELEEIAKGHIPHPDEGKPNKFGVVLRRTESGRLEKRRTSTTITVEIDGVKTDVDIEEIYDMDVLENLLEKIIGYDLRRRIRAQIRVVKKLVEERKIETVTTKKVFKLISPAKPSRETPEKKRPTPDRKTETTETRTTYSYSERRRSSDVKLETKQVTRTHSPETKIITKTTTSVKKDNESKVSRGKSPESKVLSPRGKTPESKPKVVPERKAGDDKPEWVTQRNLKKVTERTVVAKKTPVKEESPVKRKSPEKETNVITSSYGVGPTDENGSPLFGLRALRAQNKNEHTKVQGLVTHSTFYSENGSEPVGEVSITKYSTDPRDLGNVEDIEHKEGILSKTTIQKFGYKDTPSYKTLTDKKKPNEKTDESRTTSTTTTTKVTRRGSVKEMSQKFLDNAVETLKSEKQSSYPKAGLILRTSSFKDGSGGSSREGSPTAETEEIRKTVKVRTSGTKGETFLTNTSKISGVQDVITRMKTEEYVEGDTEEDAEARTLLNKFLGSQVLLSGMESQMRKQNTSAATTTTTSGSSTKRVTKVTTTITENGVPRTTTTSYTHPITSDVLENIWDEQTLRLLLDQSTEYEERRIIRAKLKQVMAEKEVCSEFVEKTIEENQTGNTQGESLLLPLLQGVLEAPEIEQTPDSGTESGEDLRSGLIAEVQNALDKLSACLCSDTSDITPERRDSLLQLVNKLQTNLGPPQEQGAGGRRNSGQSRFSRRKQRPNRHTVGVTSEELEDARRFMEEIALRKDGSEGSVVKYSPVKNSLPKPYGSGTSSSVDTPTTESMDFTYGDIPYNQSMSLDYDAGIYKKPLMQSYSLDYTQDEEIKKAVQQAALVKVIKGEIETDEDVTLKEGDRVVLYDQGLQKKVEDVKPDLILETNPLYRNPPEEDKSLKFNSVKKLKMKRANTIDIPKPLNFYQIDDDDSDGENVENDANKRRSAYLALRGPIRVGKTGNPHVVPAFEPKTESDKKFLAFLNKQNQNTGVANKISLWDKSTKAEGNTNWQSKFGNIKTNFEKASTGEGKRNLNAARNFWKSADDAVSAGTVSYKGPTISRQNARNLQQMFEQKQKHGFSKLPWSEDKSSKLSYQHPVAEKKVYSTQKSVNDRNITAGNLKVAWDEDKNVVTGSLKVEPHKNYKFVPQPLSQNKFSHNPQSAFKPIQKEKHEPTHVVQKNQIATDSETPIYLYSPKSHEKQNSNPPPWGKSNVTQGERRVLSLAASKFEHPVHEEPKIKPKRVVKEKVAIPQTLKNFEPKEKLPNYVAPQEQNKVGGSVRKLSGQYNSLNQPTHTHQSAFAPVPKSSSSKGAQKYFEIVEGKTSAANFNKPTPREHKPISHTNKPITKFHPKEPAPSYNHKPQNSISYPSEHQKTPAYTHEQGVYENPSYYNQNPIYASNNPPDVAHYTDYKNYESNNTGVKSNPNLNFEASVKAVSHPIQDFSYVNSNSPYVAPSDDHNYTSSLPQMQPPEDIYYSPSAAYPAHDFPVQLTDNTYDYNTQDISTLMENTPSYIETIESYEPNANPVRREVYSSPRPLSLTPENYLETSIKPISELPPSFHTTSPAVQHLQKLHHIDPEPQVYHKKPITYHAPEPEPKDHEPHVYYNNVHPNEPHYSVTTQVVQIPKLMTQTSNESLHEYTPISSKVMSGPVSQQAVTVQQATPKSRNEHDMEQAFNLKSALQKIDTERKSPKPPNFRINDKPLNLESLEINDKGESIVTSKFQIPMKQEKKVEIKTKEKPRSPQQSYSSAKFQEALITAQNNTKLPPNKGQMLSKCDSWHQICQDTQTSKKPSPRASPNSRSISKSKSTHTLALPKQFEAGMSKDEMVTKKRTMEAYFGSGSRSPQNISGKKSPRSGINRMRTAEKEKVETTRKTFSDGPFTKTQVTTTTRTSTQQVKKPLSPFAKFRQLDKQNSLPTPPSTPKTPTSGGPLFKFTDPNLTQSASTIKERLLQWCRMKTKEYENINLENFSTSWADGLAFCALVHHFLPDAFDYHKLTPNNRRYNFTLSFQVAYEKADIYPLLDVDDMVATRKPDWKCVFTYVQSIYRRFKDED